MSTSQTVDRDDDSGTDSEDAQSRDRKDAAGVAAARPSKPLKRSCNNCRQQKLRCDVVQSPFTACSRCARLEKTCQIEKEFKRIGKRDKYAKMQREIDDLKRKLQAAAREGRANLQGAALAPAPASATASIQSAAARQLGEHLLSGEFIDELFREYFTSYHPFLPFLDPESTPDHYFGLTPLLGWSIIMVAARRHRRHANLIEQLRDDYQTLVRSAISDVPQYYYVVKALCLICFWPLPTTLGHLDPTFRLCGMMMQTALQNLLHRPIQNFLRIQGSLPEAEQYDRLITWTACNIVTESTCSIYGLPTQANYSRLLRSDLYTIGSHRLPNDLIDQVKISHFYNKATQTLYCDKLEPSGIVSISEREGALLRLSQQYSDLEMQLGSDISVANQLYLLAANVHLNVFAFFLPVESSRRDHAFHNLYSSACTFIQKVMEIETSTGTLLEHCSSLISQTVFSSIWTLLRLLNSSFASKVNIEHGKAIFNASILAARKMSLQEGDLASRMATRVPQQWQDWGAGAPWSPSKPDRLILRLQFRMSVSHGYDCMFQWKARSRGLEESTQSNEPVTAGPANNTASLSQPLGDASFDIPPDPMFSEFDIDNFDIFTSMDWNLGEWPEIPLPLYE